MGKSGQVKKYEKTLSLLSFHEKTAIRTGVFEVLCRKPCVFLCFSAFLGDLDGDGRQTQPSGAITIQEK